MKHPQIVRKLVLFKRAENAGKKNAEKMHVFFLKREIVLFALPKNSNGLKFKPQKNHQDKSKSR